MDCVGDKVYSVTVFHHLKSEHFFNKLFTSKCPSEHSHLCGRMQCVLRFSVSSALQLLGHSSVGVMDPQNHCAVVTLVVSNCLKKLMSHSCPSSYFVLLRYAGTGTGVGVQGKGVVT
jgi:hypothetical protein